MLVEKLDDLVDQPLNGWHLERWYAIYKQTQYSFNTLMGYCHHVDAKNFLKKNLILDKVLR